MLVTKLCPHQKEQKHPLKWKFLTKKNGVLDFWNLLSVRFLEYQKHQFLRFFIFYFFWQRNALFWLQNQTILNEIKQSNGIKPQKINFFSIFCKFLPQKGNFFWKVPSKVIYTFYLKHQKYPFRALIFHPLPETESCPSLYILKQRLTTTKTHTKASPASHHVQVDFFLANSN